MPQRRRAWILYAALTLPLLIALATFFISAVLAEGALRPLRLRRASDTAALARNIAEASLATATRVQIAAPDGTALVAWWLAPQTSTDRGVMLCHGVADSASGALGYSLLFLRNGYSVLVPESRGHGESKGLNTYGVLESRDTLLWLQWMKAHGVRQTFGLGESLGAAILLQSLAQGASFKAIVAECPYSSFKAIAEERITRFLHGGSLPGALAIVLTDEAFLYTRLRYGVDLNRADTAEAASRATIPILLIHGLADHETSPLNSERIAARNRTHISLWLVPGAPHTGAYATDPALFEQKVLRCFSPAVSPLRFHIDKQSLKIKM